MFRWSRIRIMFLIASLQIPKGWNSYATQTGNKHQDKLHRADPTQSWELLFSHRIQERHHCWAHWTRWAPPCISSSSSYASWACCACLRRISSSMLTSCSVVSSQSSSSMSVSWVELLGGSTASNALHCSGFSESGNSTVKCIYNLPFINALWYIGMPSSFIALNWSDTQKDRIN